MEEKLLKIISYYGIDNQQRKLEEEVYELQEAIISYKFANWCFNDKEVIEIAREQIADELGDVINVLDEIRLYYKIPKETVMNKRIPKIERQLERMKEVENE